MGPGAIAAIAIIGFALLLGGGKGNGNGAKPKYRDPDLPDLPGTGEIDPGPANQGPKPGIVDPESGTKGWGGGQYGPGPVPDDFDWNGNHVYISEDCKTVAEPLKFLPIPGSETILRWHYAGEFTTGDLPTALGVITPTYGDPQGPPTTGTAWGVAFDLVNNEGVEDPIEVASDIFRQALEMEDAECGNIADSDTWPKALRDWWNSLSDRLNHWVPQITVTTGGVE